MNEPEPKITGSRIKAQRGKKNSVDPCRPYAYNVEKEITRSGKVEDTATVFLTNRECQYRCLMCDLWKNTTDYTVPVGAIPEQIKWALDHLPAAKQLKLYNSGSFFDRKAIPPEDFRDIADLVSGFETLIVESHPMLIDNECLRFREMLKPELQVAMGLETVHPEVLRRLNKMMTPHDFRRASVFLNENGIPSRAFILLRPPFLTEKEGIYWAKKSIDFAFDSGTECCVIIPVRSGNGAMDFLAENGYFHQPEIRSLEEVIEYGISLNAGRVFADLWDIERFSTCGLCSENRIKRLESMNFSQKIPPPVNCKCCS